MNEVSTAGTGGKRVLGLNLSPGTTTGNLLNFYLSCVAAILLASFMPQMQPYLLLVWLLFYSFSMAAVRCTLANIITDFIADESRGKGAGIQGFINGSLTTRKTNWTTI